MSCWNCRFRPELPATAVIHFVVAPAQHNTSPSMSRAYECADPRAMLVAVMMPETSMGVVLELYTSVSWLTIAVIQSPSSSLCHPSAGHTSGSCLRRPRSLHLKRLRGNKQNPQCKGALLSIFHLCKKKLATSPHDVASDVTSDI